MLGHRGARRGAFENTMAAFQLAREEGADGVELDVQCSGDGIPFVLHDVDLERVTEGRDTRKVRDLSATELERVTLVDGNHPPRLDEVLAWAEQTGMLLNVELKTAQARNDAVAERVAALLEAHPALLPQILVSSFHPRLLGRFQAEAPGVPIGFLFTRTHVSWLECSWQQRLRLSALHPDGRCFLLRGPMRWPADLLVNAWTIDQAADVLLVAKCGVDAIISDCPGDALAVLGST